MAVWSKEYFNQKIDRFAGHEKYPWLREKADDILRNFDGPAWASIAATDFMDRIIAMPEDYIREWLDGKNELHWRDVDEAMLMAIKGEYVDLLEAHPHADIRLISESSAKFYADYGFEIERNPIWDMQSNPFGFTPRVFAVKDKGFDAVLENADERSGATQFPISDDKLEIVEFSNSVAIGK